MINRVAGVIEAEIDGERVLLAPENLTYFGLNEVGARVWDLIGSDGTDLDGVVTALLSEFDVDPETCRREVSQFLDAGAAAGVLASTD